MKVLGTLRLYESIKNAFWRLGFVFIFYNLLYLINFALLTIVFNIFLRHLVWYVLAEHLDFLIKTLDSLLDLSLLVIGGICSDIYQLHRIFFLMLHSGLHVRHIHHIIVVELLIFQSLRRLTIFDYHRLLVISSGVYSFFWHSWICWVVVICIFLHHPERVSPFLCRRGI